MKRWKKRIEAQRAKPRTRTPAVDALIGDEEQTRKKEKSKERIYNPATLDYLVASYDPHGSYGASIVKFPTE